MGDGVRWDEWDGVRKGRVGWVRTLGMGWCGWVGTIGRVEKGYEVGWESGESTGALSLASGSQPPNSTKWTYPKITSWI